MMCLGRRPSRHGRDVTSPSSLRAVGEGRGEGGEEARGGRVTAGGGAGARCGWYRGWQWCAQGLPRVEGRDLELALLLCPGWQCIPAGLPTPFFPPPT